MRWALVAICCAVASLATPVCAQDTRDAELATADTGLNEAYQAVIRQLSPVDQVALRKAQRAWIAFRDADCAFGLEDHRDCLIQRTDERERQLRETVYLDARGIAFTLPNTSR